MDTRDLERKLSEAATRRGDAAAQATARQVSANAPRGETLKLSQAPTIRRVVSPTAIAWTIGVDVKSDKGYPYDKAQEEGTGIYIGRGPIRPTHKPYLKFFWRKRGHWMRVKSVRGTPPTRFFSKAMRDWPARLREAGGR